jgi:POT family proton-dependent oligopeptide transporter
VGGVAGIISRAYPFVLPLLALAMPIYYAIRVAHGDDKPISLVMPIAFAIVFIVMGGLLRKLGGAAKDKSIVIFVVFVFVVLFWMAFEQAGNALNLWAEFFTDRHIGSSSYTAESFQSANPIFILLFAPAFSALWLWMAKRGFEPRTSVKILVAMVFMAASFAIMVVGAARENAVVTRVDKPFTVPKELAGKELDAGRLTLKDGSIEVRGVLAHYVVQDMFEKVAPQGWVDWAKGLDDTTKNATAASPVTLPVTAATFKMPFDDKAAKEAGVTLAANELVFTKHADAQVRAAIAAAAAPPEFREAVSEAENESLTARNTGLWLLLSYLFATLGELCLSPVGLSMVTKLAPRRFASLFMGVWLLTSSVAQYAGGSIGESWGAITPMSYFWLFVWTSLAGAVVLVLLVKPLNKLMHEVH